jgi:hypothetical protein
MSDKKLQETYWEQKLRSMGPPVTEEQNAQIKKEHAYYKNHSPKIENGILVKEMDAFPDLPFVFSGLVRICWALYGREAEYLYLLDGKNREQAMEDILSLNTVIKNTETLTKHQKDALRIRPEALHFTTENIKIPAVSAYWNRDFSYFVCSPFTKTGKKAKFPLTLFFTTRNTSLEYGHQFDYLIEGNVNYLQSGKIGKFSIARYYRMAQTDFFSGNISTQTFSTEPFKQKGY